MHAYRNVSAALRDYKYYLRNVVYQVHPTKRKFLQWYLYE